VAHTDADLEPDTLRNAAQYSALGVSRTYRTANWLERAYQRSAGPGRPLRSTPDSAGAPTPGGTATTHNRHERYRAARAVFAAVHPIGAVPVVAAASSQPDVRGNAPTGSPGFSAIDHHPRSLAYQAQAPHPRLFSFVWQFERRSAARHDRTVARSSERPAWMRDHWAVGRPFVRRSTHPSCGQSGGESSHVSCRP
jgi:hypothetical protein